MDEAELIEVVEQVRALLEAHYLYPGVAGTVSRALAQGLAGRRYPADASARAAADTADLQSVHGGKHPPLEPHEEPLPQRTAADDPEENPPVAPGGGRTRRRGG